MAVTYRIYNLFYLLTSTIGTFLMEDCNKDLRLTSHLTSESRLKI